jgi:hypothetical protein
MPTLGGIIRVLIRNATHIHDSKKDVVCMCKNDKEEKDMSAIADKKTFQPLDKKKKDVLKNFIGSVSQELDLNKVRDEWKNGENRL